MTGCGRDAISPHIPRGHAGFRNINIIATHEIRRIIDASDLHGERLGSPGAMLVLYQDGKGVGAGGSFRKLVGVTVPAVIYRVRKLAVSINA